MGRNVVGTAAADSYDTESAMRSTLPAGTTTYATAQDQALRQFRTAYVAQMLAQHQGNVSRAAAAAGVSRRTFHRWIADAPVMAPDQESA